MPIDPYAPSREAWDAQQAAKREQDKKDRAEERAKIRAERAAERERLRVEREAAAKAKNKATHGGFKEYEHLRGSDGRFIKKNGDVDVIGPDGKTRRATVMTFTEEGPYIQYEDGSYATIPIGEVTKRIKAAPVVKARIAKTKKKAKEPPSSASNAKPTLTPSTQESAVRKPQTASAALISSGWYLVDTPLTAGFFGKKKVQASKIVSKAASIWEEWRHPRDREGQFIEVGAIVNVFEKSNGPRNKKHRGRVVQLTKTGPLVEFSDPVNNRKRREIVNTDNIEVAPESVARIDATAHVKPSLPEGLTPEDRQFFDEMDARARNELPDVPNLKDDEPLTLTDFEELLGQREKFLADGGDPADFGDYLPLDATPIDDKAGIDMPSNTSPQNEARIRNAANIYGKDSKQYKAAVSQFGGDLPAGTRGKSDEWGTPELNDAELSKLEADRKAAEKKLDMAGEHGTYASWNNLSTMQHIRTLKPKSYWPKEDQDKILAIEKEYGSGSRKHVSAMEKAYLDYEKSQGRGGLTAFLTRHKILASGAPMTGLTAAVFLEWQHPRDRKGRFIERGSVVDIDGNHRGKVTDLTEQGPEVKFDDTGETEVIEDLDRIEVAPEAAATLDEKPKPSWAGKNLDPLSGPQKTASDDNDPNDPLSEAYKKPSGAAKPAMPEGAVSPKAASPAAPAAPAKPSTVSVLPGTADRNAKLIQAAKEMYGEGSKQHLAAIKKFTPPKDVTKGKAANADLIRAVTRSVNELRKVPGYQNPYALELSLQGLKRKIDEAADDATVMDIIDSAFSGRYRGQMVKQMRSLGYKFPPASATASGAVSLISSAARVYGPGSKQHKAAFRRFSTALTAGFLDKVWLEWQHPRDRNGRFIEVGALVDIINPNSRNASGKDRGIVSELTELGPVIKFPDGRSHVVNLDNIEVAPESVARIDPENHRNPFENLLPEDMAFFQQMDNIAQGKDLGFDVAVPPVESPDFRTTIGDIEQMLADPQAAFANYMQLSSVPAIVRNGDTIVVPEESKRLGTEAYQRAVSNEPRISAALVTLVGDQNPGQYEFPTGRGGKMFGFDKRLKSESGLQEKVERIIDEKKMQRAQAATDIKDSVRYTVHFPEETFSQDAQRVIDQLSEQNADIEVKNTWGNPKIPYKGINVVVTESSGLMYEVQFHTPVSQELKDALHPIYEEQRLLDRANPRWKILEDQMHALSAKVAPPLGAAEIRSSRAAVPKDTSLDIPKNTSFQNSAKIRNAENIYGRGSAQHRAALRQFGGNIAGGLEPGIFDNGYADRPYEITPDPNKAYFGVK